MKTLRVFSLATLCMALACISNAQTKTETIKVSGNCGMCKKKIETASKDAGATYALWNKDTKILTVKYNSSSTNTAKIEKKIAGVGYDTPDFKATEEAYKKLDECCQYERNTVTITKKASCCQNGKCTDERNGGKDCCKKEAKGKTTMNCCNGDKKTDTQQ